MGPVTETNQPTNQPRKKERKKGVQRKEGNETHTPPPPLSCSLWCSLDSLNEDRNSTDGDGGGISLYYERCFHGQVHPRAPTRSSIERTKKKKREEEEEERKKARALYIMIRHFGITYLAAPRPPRRGILHLEHVRRAERRKPSRSRRGFPPLRATLSTQRLLLDGSTEELVDSRVCNEGCRF